MPALGSIEDYHEKRRRAEGRGRTFHEDPVKDLSDYLAGPFLSGLPLRMTSWRPDATGQQLADHMVSRLEVVKAIGRLPNHLYWTVRLLYEQEQSPAAVAVALRVSERTVFRRRLEAVEAMVPFIYDPPWVVTTGTLGEVA